MLTIIDTAYILNPDKMSRKPLYVTKDKDK